MMMNCSSLFPEKVWESTHGGVRWKTHWGWYFRQAGRKCMTAEEQNKKKMLSVIQGTILEAELHKNQVPGKNGGFILKP